MLFFGSPEVIPGHQLKPKNAEVQNFQEFNIRLLRLENWQKNQQNFSKIPSVLGSDVITIVAEVLW